MHFKVNVWQFRRNPVSPTQQKMKTDRRGWKDKKKKNGRQRGGRESCSGILAWGHARRRRKGGKKSKQILKNELKHTSHCRHHSPRAPNLKPYLSSLGTSQVRVSAPRTISQFIFRNSPTKTVLRRTLTRRPERPRQLSTVGSTTVYGALTTQHSVYGAKRLDSEPDNTGLSVKYQ